MISPKNIKPSGKVDLWDTVDGVQVEMHATDAAHALTVDPERWSLTKPEPAPEPAPESEPEPEPELPAPEAPLQD